jgi:CheY-like chemotaxis protein
MDLFDGQRYYHRIPGLLIPRVATNNEIHNAINLFIDTAFEITNKLETHFMNIVSTSRQSTFAKTMELLVKRLQNIFARGLEAEGERILRYTHSETQLPLVQRSLKPFITDVLSLSITLQKAQTFENDKRLESLSSIEVLANISQNIAVICNLINDNEFGKSKKFIIELIEFIPEDKDFTLLLDLIRKNYYVEAKTAAFNLKQKYDEKVTKLAGTDLSKIILAVDDMPEILAFVNHALKNRYKVIAVPGGKPAIKVMETHTPSLFILDIDMPEMNGFELAAIIRNKPEHKNTPLIFLTGNSSRAHITQAIAVGCNDFIVKPTNHEYLLTKAGKFLNI